MGLNSPLVASAGEGLVSPGGVERALQTPGGKRILSALLESKAQVENKKTSCSTVLSGKGLALQSMDPKVLASQLNEILAQAHTLNAALAEELWLVLEHGFEGDSSSLEKWIQTESFQRILFENSIDRKWVGDSKGASRWMSYEEARRYIQGETIEGTAINTLANFHKWSKSGKRPSNFPSNPWVVYADKGWVDWFHFLGKAPRGQWISYEEARRYIQGETIERTPINDVAKFQKWSKSGKRPSNFPSDPWRVYAGKGWVNWFHFLGKTPRNPGQWMSYEEAREYIQGETIEGTPINDVAKFQKWSQSGKRPSNFPSKPWDVYVDKGWVNWFHFLGKAPRGQWISYEEARRYIQGETIEGTSINDAAKFQKWSKSGKRPSNFPSNPWRIYADKGWVDWFHFLGKTPGTPTHQWMSYEEARRYIQGETIEGTPINSVAKFKKWSKSGKRPSNFPSHPWDVYAGKGWVDGFHFLGKNPNYQWMSYEEARRYIQGETIEGTPINTLAKFKEWSKSGKRPSNFPSKPWDVYAGKGWVDGFHFLGKTPGTPTHQWMSYEEARRYIQGETIEGTPINAGPKFHKWSKSGKRPSNFPSNPWDVYVDKGWVNWFHFLGKAPRGQWISYEEARRYIQGETIEGTSINDAAKFQKWSKSGKRPSNFPSNPWRIYADKGWVDWFHFLGKTPGTPIHQWMSYEEAMSYIQGETIEGASINTLAKFQKWSKSGKRPSNFPANPWRVYADKGWVDWFHFLGKTPRNPTGQWISYEEARSYIQGETIEGTPINTLAKFQKWSKSGKRPPNFPANPWIVYADKGWVDGFHFLGKAPRGQWISYEEARSYIQGETIDETPINTLAKFHKWSKSGKRPSNFPSNPWVVYADKGWLDWFHFLGKAPRGQWISYEEARRYIQGETIERTPINDVAKFQKWSKSGKRPSNFPSDPFRVYAGKGWVDWFHFLGKTPRNPTGQWMSYEEARRYIQGETIEGTPINVVAKFKQWSQSGKRPSNFPAHPWTVYAGKGWVDWFHFLGTPRKTPRAPRVSKTIQWMSYEEARKYVQSIGLNEGFRILNRTDFWRWSRSEKRPPQFPASPELTYKDEWQGWDSFLGLESAE